MIVFLILILSKINYQEFYYGLIQVKWHILLILILLQVGSQALLNYQWFRLAKVVGLPLSFAKMLFINSQGSVVESITPGVKIGGEVTRAFYLSKILPCSSEEAGSVVALQKIFSLSAFFLINLFSVLYLADQVPFLRSLYIRVFIYGVLLTFLAIFAVAFWAPKQATEFLQCQKPAEAKLAKWFRNFLLILFNYTDSLQKKRKESFLQFLLSMFIWVIYPIKMYILTVQFSLEINPVYICAITFVSYMVAMVPIFPGGLGSFEATMSGLLLIAGLSIGEASVISIVFRFITFWFVFLASFGYAVGYKMFHNTKFDPQNGKISL